ncbi:MAG: FAD-dependent oxidoreductase [Eggerthellales bacterium]|nr:FAD-dependent oxidoreductase [Eggerthellales bacterium]
MFTESVSRRQFLSAAAIGSAGVAAASVLGGCSPASPAATGAGDGASAVSGAPSFLTAPEPIPAEDIVETFDTQVAIVGGGLAGCCVAASCLDEGLQVFMVEKAEEARAIGLDYGLINPSIIAEKGLEPVSVYEMARDHMEKSCHMCRGDKTYRFMSRSGEAGDWWFNRVEPLGLEPQVIGMRSNSDHYKNNYVVELWHKGVNLATEPDCYAPTAEIIASIHDEVNTAGTYMNNTEAVQLVTAEDGSITGVICNTADGYIQINASKGVVMCAGDYAADPEMLNHYTEWKYDAYSPEFFANYSTGTGDGVKMGLWAGAKVQDAPHPLMIFMAYAYSYLRVNKLGQRYVNEDSGYVGGGNAQLNQPEAISFAIWDDKWREELPAQLPYAGGMSWDQDFRLIDEPWDAEREEMGTWSWETEGGLLVQADTLEDLADQLGMDAEAKATFLQTVERYNQLVDEGDCDFGKRPELMCKIQQAPFYGLKMVVEVALSVAGLETNADSECINEEGKVIPGLFAVGNNAGGLFGVDYNEVTVPGISLGRNVTFGYLLGKHLASK